MRDIFKVLEQIKEVLDDEEYGEIKANMDNIEYALRYKAPELQWDYVYDRLIMSFIPPETYIDYKVFSILSVPFNSSTYFVVHIDNTL